MAYIKKVWENAPATSSPISAANLNNIENGLELVDIAAFTGWYPVAGSFNYGSADAPTFTMIAPGDLTAIFKAGAKIKLTQTTVKYFICTKDSTYAAGNTSITMYGGTDYTLANAAISNLSISRIKAPTGFPLDPAKWSVVVTDSVRWEQVNAVSGTIYNPNNKYIDVPPGLWNLGFLSMPRNMFSSETTLNLRYGISTANNAFANSIDIDNIFANLSRIDFTYTISKAVLLASKTRYYSVIQHYTSSTSLVLNNSLPATITAVCLYL